MKTSDSTPVPVQANLLLQLQTLTLESSLSYITNRSTHT